AERAVRDHVGAEHLVDGGVTLEERRHRPVAEVEHEPGPVEAMGDRSRFGLAKSMFSDGPEFELPDDPDALATQSLSEPATPPVAIPYLPPSEAELEASARRAPVLAHFEALCEFLGP